MILSVPLMPGNAPVAGSSLIPPFLQIGPEILIHISAETPFILNFAAQGNLTTGSLFV
jgi:hypothetical protein